MVNKFKKVLALLALLFVISPATASAAEIPFLTWERGQLQEVVLGSLGKADNWRIELQEMEFPAWNSRRVRLMKKVLLSIL